MLAVTMAAVLATSAPNPTWRGVGIGESMKQVRADLGDPLTVAPMGDGMMSLYYTMIATTCAGKSTPKTLYFDIIDDGAAAP